MDIALHIPDFWCGFIAGFICLFALAVALGMRKDRKDQEPPDQERGPHIDN